MIVKYEYLFTYSTAVDAVIRCWTYPWALLCLRYYIKSTACFLVICSPKIISTKRQLSHPLCIYPVVFALQLQKFLKYNYYYEPCSYHGYETRLFMSYRHCTSQLLSLQAYMPWIKRKSIWVGTLPGTL